MSGEYYSSEGFYSPPVREQAGPRPPPEVVDARIAAALAKRPARPRPMRLAINVEYGPCDWRNGDSDGPGSQGWLDSAPDWIPRLKEDGLVSEILYLDKGLIRAHDDTGEFQKKLMQMARSTKADTLLNIRCDDGWNRRATPFGILYLTVIGTLLPATIVEVRIVAEASLWDVRTGALHFSTFGEAEAWHLVSPAMDRYTKVTFKAATRAMDELGENLLSRLNGAG